MASVKRIDGKNGVSYKITVTLGTDGAGNQKRHYMTWKPDKPMKPREMEREARRIATEFETRLMEGIEADNKQTFAEYAEYVYRLRVQRGDKPQTLTSVRQMTQRINGYSSIWTGWKMPCPGRRKGGEKGEEKERKGKHCP